MFMCMCIYGYICIYVCILHILYFTGIINIISKLGLLFLFILLFDARCTVFNSLFHVLMYVIYQEIKCAVFCLLLFSAMIYFTFGSFDIVIAYSLALFYFSASKYAFFAFI